MPTRRDFLKSAALLAGGSFVSGSIPEAIARALAIDPDKDSTFLDAEHVVILMQENRSFDHCYGALRGVRGYRDPRAHRLPNGNPVWFQTDASGNTYAPFRLDIKRTNATWIGSLPHSWPDQVDARNGGRYDKWLIAKRRAELPFTLGHYNREDLPFYYAFADAFTVCDQAFCSSLTGTTPNRLFLWTGTIREDAKSTARVMNGDTDYDLEAAWTTYPERLQDAGISWRIYQNEISLDTGFKGEEDPWLANFTDNPIEWFTQYNVRFSKTRRAYVAQLLVDLPKQIAKNEQTARVANMSEEQGQKLGKETDELRAKLKAAQDESARYNDKTWAALSKRERELHERAFATNEGDPDYRKLATLNYDDQGTSRSVQVPKGDTLHRFREDVRSGKLPTVSWIVASENFSDHPGAAWYGAWYVSECLNILTENPEVWKKTIFVLCYDENDGYFDHVPPFVAPFPGRPETGKVSDGIDTTEDVSNAHGRESSIGLGFRCPLVVASPWSRGGYVNSEVCDHTSIIRLIETWLAGKGKPVVEHNISAWRRTVCGDLTSTFRPYHGETIALPTPLDRDATVKSIYTAKFQARPKGGAPLGPDEIAKVKVGDAQEPGTRPSNGLNYELVVNGAHTVNGLEITMEARNKRFGKRSLGSAFNAYSYGSQMVCRNYAVAAGKAVQDTFGGESAHHVRIDGPNGFMREFRSEAGDSPLSVTVTDGSGKLKVLVKNAGSSALPVSLRDESYGAPVVKQSLKASGSLELSVDTSGSAGWYDFSVLVGGLAYRYAGRLETGKASTTDPAMA